MLVDFLCANKDIFVLKPSDMPIIHREVAEHALNIKPDAPLAEQHHRLVREHLHGEEEEEAADAEYDFADDTTEEGDE